MSRLNLAFRLNFDCFVQPLAKNKAGEADPPRLGGGPRIRSRGGPPILARGGLGVAPSPCASL